MSGIKRSGPKVSKKIYLPVELAGEIDLLLVDELRRKPQYGALSQLITVLLEKYLSELKGKPNVPGFSATTGSTST